MNSLGTSGSFEDHSFEQRLLYYAIEMFQGQMMCTSD